MIKIVVDSSVVIKWLNQHNENLIEQADGLLLNAMEQKIELIAPELVKYEIGNVLLTSKQLSISEASEAIEFFFSIPINFVIETQELAESTYKIGQELKITYYDASFLSVAEQLGATLVTDNVKHHGKSTKVKVIPLKDY